MEYPNLPYLIDGDVKLTETLAIMKYVCKKWKPELLGRTAAEVGRVNMLEYYV
jgi:glutathione S-transferase